MTKTNYLKTEHAKRFATIAATMDFEVAVETAVLAYMVELGMAKDAQDAAARNWKREGVLRFLDILENIAKPDQVRAEAGLGYKEMVKT